jgi:hypothetical protein
MLRKKRGAKKKCQYLMKHDYTDEMKQRKREELEALDGKYTIKQRPMDTTIPVGTFGIQKLYIKPSLSSPRHLRVLYDIFGKTELKLGKAVSKLPPISHDVTVMKRVNGK